SRRSRGRGPLTATRARARQPPSTRGGGVLRAAGLARPPPSRARGRSARGAFDPDRPLVRALADLARGGRRRGPVGPAARSRAGRLAARRRLLAARRGLRAPDPRRAGQLRGVPIRYRRTPPTSCGLTIRSSAGAQRMPRDLSTITLVTPFS